MSSELCLSTTSDSSKFHSLLLNDLFFFCSFILSHPLYFSYFIFFSPYLLKLLSFLSPLFITTSLLLLAIHLTFFPASQFNHHNPGFLLSTFLTITDRLRSKIDQKNEDPCNNFEEFEVYKIVFDHTSTIDVREINHIEASASASAAASDSEGTNCVTKFCTHEQVSSVTKEERKLESFLELLDKFENMGKSKCNVEEKKVDDEPPCPKSNKVVGELQKEDLVSGSEAKLGIKIRDDHCTVKVGITDNDGNGYAYLKKKIGGNVNDSDHRNGGDQYSLNLDSSRSFDSNDLGSYGSMRKEKEWKRTLACKLFEERHNVGGEEGMDSLWETYETDLSKKDSRSTKVIVKNKSERNSKKNNNNRKTSGINSEYYYGLEDEDDDDEELANGKICCLQALKLSSGKMNFGMGKPNLVKISKALKGIGWLHRVSRHGKKDRF